MLFPTPHLDLLLFLARAVTIFDVRARATARRIPQRNHNTTTTLNYFFPPEPPC